MHTCLLKMKVSSKEHYKALQTVLGHAKNHNLNSLGSISKMLFPVQNTLTKIKKIALLSLHIYLPIWHKHVIELGGNNLSEFFSFCIDVSLDFTFFSGIETAHFANFPTRSWKKRHGKLKSSVDGRTKRRDINPQEGYI